MPARTFYSLGVDPHLSRLSKNEHDARRELQQFSAMLGGSGWDLLGYIAYMCIGWGPMILVVWGISMQDKPSLFGELYYLLAIIGGIIFGHIVFYQVVEKLQKKRFDREISEKAREIEREYKNKFGIDIELT